MKISMNELNSMKIKIMIKSENENENEWNHDEVDDNVP